jgi:hypothetical protein
MKDTVYITFAALLFVMLCVIAGGVVIALLNKPQGKRQQAAHDEALDHLAAVARLGFASDPRRDVLEEKLAAILEIKNYPEAGDVGAWEARTAHLVYGDSDDEPTDGWDRVLLEFRDFAGVNLYSAFSVALSVKAYERAREALAAVGVTARPVAETALGRL